MVLLVPRPIIVIDDTVVDVAFNLFIIVLEYLLQENVLRKGTQLSCHERTFGENMCQVAYVTDPPLFVLLVDARILVIPLEQIEPQLALKIRALLLQIILEVILHKQLLLHKGLSLNPSFALVVELVEFVVVEGANHHLPIVLLMFVL